MVRKVRSPLSSILPGARPRRSERCPQSPRRAPPRKGDTHQSPPKGSASIFPPGRNPRADRCARPLLLTAIFTGLRASELRGLRWEDVDLKVGELHVRQRANSFNAIGRPKSEAGERTVPLPPMLVNVLRELRLAGPKGDAAHSNDFSVFFATSMKARSLGANEARRG